jgi:DNA polymerase elongation subunit (family B)
MVRGDRMSANVQKMVNKEIDTSELYQKDYALTPKGVLYKRDKQGMLPELMEKFYDERKLWKKKMIGYQQEKEKTDDPKRLRELDTLIKRAYNNQQVRKIALNSAYGALANQYFAFYSTDLAESITSSGQMVIKWAEKTVNKYLNKVLGTEDEDFVIAIDTDSVYITFEKLVDMVFPDQSDQTKIVDFLNTVAVEKIEKILAEGYDDLANYTNAFKQKMFMDREVIADYGIWTAKKRYILNVFDNEGVRYKTPKLKMMGIETAKSSTPMWVRSKLEEAFRVIMTHNESDLWEFVEQAREEFKSLSVEEVSFPRGCNGLHNYRDASTIYRKGTPIHVRGSLVYNHQLVENKLDRIYETIAEGNKIKFCYLTLPNPINENVISFPMNLPSELELEKFVDYELQFEKTFLEPLNAVISKIGWTTEPVASLDAFFG